MLRLAPQPATVAVGPVMSHVERSGSASIDPLPSASTPVESAHSAPEAQFEASRACFNGYAATVLGVRRRNSRYFRRR